MFKKNQLIKLALILLCTVLLAGCMLWGDVEDLREEDSTSPADKTPPTLSAGSVARSSDTAATISFNTDEAGMVYYIVYIGGASAPTSAQVKAGTRIGAVTVGANTGLAVTLTAGARDIYVVVEDAAGNISNPLKISAAEYVAPDTTPPTLSAGSVARTSDTAATISFNTNEAGTAYYLVQASEAAAPTSTQVKAGTSLGAVTVGANTGLAVTLTAGPRDIYVVVEDAAKNISSPLKISAAAYDAPDTTPPTLSVGSVARTSDTAATISFNTDEAGNAYYIVYIGGASAPTPAQAKLGNSLGAVTVGANTGKSVTLTAGARDIYVVVEDAAGNISAVLLISAAAYLNPALSSGSVARTSDTAATISFTSNKAGTAYYQELTSGTTAPASVAVRSGGTSLGSVVNGSNTGLAVTLTAGARDIYVVVQDSDSNISAVLLISAAAYDAPDTTPPALSAGSVARTNDTAATISFNTNEAGTAYYLVQANGAAAPASAQVKAGTSLGAVTVGANTGLAITLTAGARDIYVVVEDAAGNISSPLKISAAAYLNPALSSGNVTRTSDTAATISFTSNKAGTAYYQQLASGATAPAPATVRSSGTSLGSVMNGSNTGKAVTLTAGARDIYVVVQDGDSNISAVLLISAAAYVPAIDMVRIPATGTAPFIFQMDGTDSGGTSRPITLTKAFYMGKYPVTQEQYEAVMGTWTNPSHFTTPVSGETDTKRRPVEQVSWYNAIAFCNRLSILEGLTPVYSITGKSNTVADEWRHSNVPTESDANWDAAVPDWGAAGYRLPTEAQWEYACRAGTTTAFNWGTNLITSEKANYDTRYVDTYNTVAETYLERTSAVGSYSPNAWGLYDMHGNVREWCWDWYGSYTNGAQTDPEGAYSGTLRLRVLRGGSWNDFGLYARSAYRDYNNPYYRNSKYGFRVVRP